MQLVSGLDTAVESTIGGLRKSHTQDPCRNGIRTGLVLCPRSMSIALNGTPGFLQFYNPLTDTVAQEVFDGLSLGVYSYSKLKKHPYVHVKMLPLLQALSISELYTMLASGLLLSVYSYT